LARAAKSRIKAISAMPAPIARQFPIWLQSAAVALMAGLAVALVFGRASWADWLQPHWLEGDPIEVYARVQIAAEQPGHALTSFSRPARLGAPFGADWAGYPVADRLVFVLTGALSRLIGLVAAVQLVSAGFFGLNALSFFLCARWLKHRWEWAAALALGFAFSNYNLRWGVTLSLGQTFTLPPLVLLCAYASRRALPLGRGRWLLLGGALGLWLGMGNPYLAFFAGIVGGGALVLALLRRAPRRRLAPLLLFLGMLTIVFFVGNVSYAWGRWHGSHLGALARDLSDFARYALRPADWFVPPADHRIPELARLGRAYLAARHGAGEFFYNYLGLLGLTGLMGLVGAALRRLPRGRGAGFDAGLGFIWIIGFGIAGGVNSWMGLAGVDMFRASTRIGIFAAVWVGFFLCGRLAAMTRRLPRAISRSLALGCAVFACWEQTPDLARRKPQEDNRVRWSAHQQLASNLESVLPAAAVFQLPIVPFPEAGRTVALPDYEHFLPFLASSSLRFSYGHLRTAPAQRWARHAAALPAPALVAALERAGFSALWIDRRGYADEAAELVGNLRALGRVELPGPAVLPITVFQLHPAATPVPPDLADPRLQDAWEDQAAAPGEVQLFALRGWHGPERDGPRRWRWAGAQATLGLWWDGPATLARLSFAAGGRSRTRLHLRVNDGAEVWSAPLAEGPATRYQLELELRPGLTTLEWTLEGETFRPGGNDPRQLGFMIENPAVSAP
jgi:phosphoglycerol transferase